MTYEGSRPLAAACPNHKRMAPEADRLGEAVPTDLCLRTEPFLGHFYRMPFQTDLFLPDGFQQIWISSPSARFDVFRHHNSGGREQ